MATATAQHFDTLTAAEELQAAGFEPKQAKVISQIIDRSRDSDSDAKQDLAGVKQEMIEVKQRLGKVETRLDGVDVRLAGLESGQKFLFWAIGIDIVLTASVLIKFF